MIRSTMLMLWKRALRLLVLLAISFSSVAPTLAAPCEWPAELIGRWKVFGCEMHGLGDCFVDTTEEWLLRDDGSWSMLRSDAVVDEGTWCLTTCEPSAVLDCQPQDAQRYLRLTPGMGSTRTYEVGLCPGRLVSWGGPCPLGPYPETTALTSNQVSEGTDWVIDEAVTVWEYVGRPIGTEGSSWSVVKGRY